jgi:hypothetical protein
MQQCNGSRLDPKGITDTVYQADDDEAYAFASAIEQALLSAGWTVSGLLKRSASA